MLWMPQEKPLSSRSPGKGDLNFPCQATSAVSTTLLIWPTLGMQLGTIEYWI